MGDSRRKVPGVLEEGGGRGDSRRKAAGVLEEGVAVVTQGGRRQVYLRREGQRGLKEGGREGTQGGRWGESRREAAGVLEDGGGRGDSRREVGGLNSPSP